MAVGLGNHAVQAESDLEKVAWYFWEKLAINCIIGEQQGNHRQKEKKKVRD